MNVAVVTGASSGIGLEIAKRLVTLGYKVYAIARDFKKTEFNNELFLKRECDLTDKKMLLALAKELKKQNLKILVNSAGIGYFAPCEEIKVENIEKMIALNLTAAILLSREFLRVLKKNRGFIFNINSISGLKPSPFGSVYGATKAALRHFGNSLFEEGRKSGLKVISINPDITKTPFFNNLHFKESDDPLSYIEPSCIANIVEDILNAREGTVITDITIQPQKFKIEKKL